LDELPACRARSERFYFVLAKAGVSLPRRTGARPPRKSGTAIRRPRPQPFYRKFAARRGIICPSLSALVLGGPTRSRRRKCVIFQAFPLLSGLMRVMGDIGLEPMTSALSIRSRTQTTRRYVAEPQYSCGFQPPADPRRADSPSSFVGRMWAELWAYGAASPRHRRLGNGRRAAPGQAGAWRPLRHPWFAALVIAVVCDPRKPRRRRHGRHHHDSTAQA
jgi:hypothetical protein